MLVTVTFEEIPNIPRFGQRVDDIGLFKRSDLRPTHNLKAVFRSIRNYLAANAVGMTRDEPLAQQIMNLIFCKIYDERFTRKESIVKFRACVDEPVEEVAARVRALFDKVITQYADVFTPSETLELDDRFITYVVGELQQYSLIECSRDVVGDAFEVFIGPSLKGGQGQFFTPRNVTQLVRGYDSRPACGSGGVFCENSLIPMGEWGPAARNEVGVGEFDVIMTSPQFGQKLKINERGILAQYDLGHKWKRKTKSEEWECTNRVLESQTPQILFLERCLDLMKAGGRMGIVLPESMLCNPSHRNIMQYLLSRATIRAVISVHENLFQPHTHAKTAVALLEKGAEPEGKNHGIFMAVARWCGHDSRGLEIP